MKEIGRQCFASLVRDKGHHYIILIDQNFAADVWADNDQDALEQFREWCNEDEKR